MSQCHVLKMSHAICNLLTGAVLLKLHNHFTLTPFTPESNHGRQNTEDMKYFQQMVIDEKNAT